MEKDNGSRPTIRTFAQFQEVYGHFSHNINSEATPTEIHGLLVDEVDELKGALDGKDKQEIGGELADVVMYAIELANQFGIVMDDAITAKLNRNYHKYNPFEMQRLMRDEGMTQKQARDHLKAGWDKGRDKTFK